MDEKVELEYIRDKKATRVKVTYKDGFYVVVHIPDDILYKYVKNTFDLMDEGEAMEYADEVGADNSESEREAYD